MYLCKALLNVCIYDKGATLIWYNNNDDNNNKHGIDFKANYTNMVWFYANLYV